MCVFWLIKIITVYLGDGRVKVAVVTWHKAIFLVLSFTSLTKQMCWTDAAVMRCAQGERGGRGGDEKCKVRKGMTEVTDRYTDGWKTYCGDSNWQADRQTDTEGESDRGQNCFFFLSDKRPGSTKAWPSTLWSTDKAKLCSFGRERATMKPNHPSTIPDPT